MHSSKALSRIEIIKKKTIFIHNIVAEKGSVIQALVDEQNARASILMHLTRLYDEQFDKLLHSGELDVLSHFEKQDIKGSYELRNFIAHDYEGIDFHVIEDVIIERLPVILKSAVRALA